MRELTGWYNIPPGIPFVVRSQQNSETGFTLLSWQPSSKPGFPFLHDDSNMILYGIDAPLFGDNRDAYLKHVGGLFDVECVDKKYSIQTRGVNPSTGGLVVAQNVTGLRSVFLEYRGGHIYPYNVPEPLRNITDLWDHRWCDSGCDCFHYINSFSRSEFVSDRGHTLAIKNK
jgi:hypothetical protein